MYSTYFTCTFPKYGSEEGTVIRTLHFICLRHGGLCRTRLPRIRTFLLASAFILLAASSVLCFDGTVTGTWLTADGRAVIEIYPCGAKICGRVAWLREPCFPVDDSEGMAGMPRIDRHNPNPALRSRKVIGLQIMEGFSREGENRWEHGTIYDSDTGKTYRSRLTLIAPNRLDLHGYIGIPLFGRSQIWTRQK